MHAAAGPARRPAKLVDRCPDTRFILDHCGNADPKAFRPRRRRGPSHDPTLGGATWRTLAGGKNIGLQDFGHRLAGRPEAIGRPRTLRRWSTTAWRCLAPTG